MSERKIVIGGINNMGGAGKTVLSNNTAKGLFDMPIPEDYIMVRLTDIYLEAKYIKKSDELVSNFKTNIDSLFSMSELKYNYFYKEIEGLNTVCMAQRDTGAITEDEYNECIEYIKKSLKNKDFI